MTALTSPSHLASDKVQSSRTCTPRPRCSSQQLHGTSKSTWPHLWGTLRPGDGGRSKKGPSARNAEPDAVKVPVLAPVLSTPCVAPLSHRMSQPDPRKLCAVQVPLHAHRPPCSTRPSWQQPQSDSSASGGRCRQRLCPLTAALPAQVPVLAASLP